MQADARLLRGISDSWAARLGLQTAWYPATDISPFCPCHGPVAGTDLGRRRAQLVPFADVGIAVADLRGGGLAPSWRLGGQLGIGADYLLSRHLTMSLLARADYFPLRLAGGHAHTPPRSALPVPGTRLLTLTP
jgi:hypothetical protein